MEENKKIIKKMIHGTKFLMKGVQKSGGLWDVYSVNIETDEEDLVRENVTTGTFNKLSETVIKTQSEVLGMENKKTEQTPFTLSDKITWVIVIIIILWVVFSLGKKDNRELAPSEIKQNISDCYKWYGEECNDPNFNPQ